MKAYEIQPGDTYTVPPLTEPAYTVENVRFENEGLMVLCTVRYADGGLGVREFQASDIVQIERPR